jgi:hypothetical protein
MNSLPQDRNPAQSNGSGSDGAVRYGETVALCRRLVNRRCRLTPRDAAWCVGVIVMFGSAVPASGQARESIRESRVRELARQAERDARGDATEIVISLDQRVRERWGDFESFPLTIVRDDDLLVTVTAPYLSFRNSLVDMLRSGRPIDQAVWTNMVVVAITPRRLGAPNIESVVVSRNGRPVVAVKNALRPMRFSNGTGDEGVLHAGEIGFSPSAFLPGATTVLTLTPRDGDPIVHGFSDDELGTLR